MNIILDKKFHHQLHWKISLTASHESGYENFIKMTLCLFQYIQMVQYMAWNQLGAKQKSGLLDDFNNTCFWNISANTNFL